MSYFTLAESWSRLSLEPDPVMVVTESDWSSEIENFVDRMMYLDTVKYLPYDLS